MVEKLYNLWETLSRKVLASVLVDDGAVIPVSDIIKGNINWFSPKERHIWRAVMACLDANTPPTVEAVLARGYESVELGYLQMITGLFNEDDNRRLIYHTEQLRQLGVWAEARRIGQELAGIEAPEKLDEAIDRINTEMAGLYASKNDRDAAAVAIDAEIWEELENSQISAIPTGLGWFDKLAGGLWLGMNHLLAAPYKAGKTTIMRNLTLRAARDGHPVDCYCAEGTRGIFVLGCQAILATQILLDAGHRLDQMRLSVLFIRRSWAVHKDKPIFTKDEYEALQEARKLWNELPIRTYDTKDGIKDLTTLHYSIKRNRMKFGTEVCWLDYSQLFGKGESIFDQQRTTSHKLADIASSEGVAMCILSQKNEAAINENKKKESYSPGVKGGGDAVAAADFVFIPTRDRDQKGIMRIQLKHSRWTATGMGMHLIEPESGFILQDLEMQVEPPKPSKNGRQTEIPLPPPADEEYEIDF